MTDAAYDALVVGAGHNGLACAAYLASSGRKVLVLEAGERPGGMAATREFADGFRVSAAAHLLHMLSPEVAKELALQRHGLAYAARNLKTVVLPGDGRQLVIDGDRLEGASANDQAAFTEFQRQIQRFAKVLNRFCARPFPPARRAPRTRQLAVGQTRLGRAHARPGGHARTAAHRRDQHL